MSFKTHTTCDVVREREAFVYAFVSHESACEALRALSRAGADIASVPRWPQRVRRLPGPEHCVSGQREFRASWVAGALEGLCGPSRPVDLLVASQKSRSSGSAACFHVWSGSVPARSFLRIEKNLLISAPELIVIQLCSSQSKLDSLLDAHVEAVHAEAETVGMLGVEDKAVVDHPLKWERVRRLIAATLVASEFAGTYRLGAGEKDADYHAQRLMSAKSLEDAISEAGNFQGTSRARRVAELMVEASASPMETVLALMLLLPADFGGFELPKPLLNHSIDVSSHNGGISDRNEVTPDFLWPRQRVALEYDSEEFHAALGEAQSSKDATRANILTALDYRVLRVTPQMMRTLPGLELLARQIAAALGEELPPMTPLRELRRHKLFMLLMPSVRA